MIRFCKKQAPNGVCIISSLKSRGLRTLFFLVGGESESSYVHIWVGFGWCIITSMNQGCRFNLTVGNFHKLGNDHFVYWGRKRFRFGNRIPLCYHYFVPSHTYLYVPCYDSSNQPFVCLRNPHTDRHTCCSILGLIFWQPELICGTNFANYLFTWNHIVHQSFFEIRDNFF